MKLVGSELVYRSQFTVLCNQLLCCNYASSYYRKREVVNYVIAVAAIT